MSRIDYITIGIVSICILAIIFLVFKMTNIFKSEEEPAPVVETIDETVGMEEDIYDYQQNDHSDVSATASTDAGTTGLQAPSSSQAGTATSKPATTSGSPSPSSTQGSSNPVTTSTPSSGGTGSAISPAPAMTSEGKYLVLAGAFTKRALADKEVDRLRKKGYSNASVEIFDRGKHAVILVDRFDNMEAAEKLAKQLRTDGINCYVKLQEGGN